MEPVRYAKILSRALAVLLALVCVANAQLIPMLVRNTPTSVVSITIGVFLTLLVASVVGLMRVERWGFIAAYLLVPVSTILHGIALVPFVGSLLPSTEARIWSVFLLNVAFLAALMIAHRGVYKTGSAGHGNRRTSLV